MILSDEWKEVANRVSDMSLTPDRASWPYYETAIMVLEVMAALGYGIVMPPHGREVPSE